MSTSTNRELEEKIEHQRKNPHLYTTLTQSVDAFGNIVTLEQVTSKINEALDKIKGYHKAKFGTEDCGAMCNYRNDDMCKIMAVYYQDIGRASHSFVRNYNDMRERFQSPNPQEDNTSV